MAREAREEEESRRDFGVTSEAVAPRKEEDEAVAPWEEEEAVAPWEEEEAMAPREEEAVVIVVVSPSAWTAFLAVLFPFCDPIPVFLDDLTSESGVLKTCLSWSFDAGVIVDDMGVITDEDAWDAGVDEGVLNADLLAITPFLLPLLIIPGIFSLTETVELLARPLNAESPLNADFESPFNVGFESSDEDNVILSCSMESPRKSSSRT